MTGIEIHLDGKPVTKLLAARAVAEVNGQSVDIGEPNEDGWISRRVVRISPRYHAYGAIQPAEIGWPSIGTVPAAEARTFAEAITLGAEIAELAEMIAAEQSGQARTQCADCDQPLDGRELACISAGCPSRPAGPARISEAAIDKALAATLGVCPATTGPDDELDREVYCDKQLGEDSKHAGNHHARVGLGDVDGGEVAWGNQDDPYIRKGTRWPADAGAASPFADGPGCGQPHPNHAGAERFACTLHRNGFHTAPGNPGSPGCQWPIRRDQPEAAPEPSGVIRLFPCCVHCRLPEGSDPCGPPDAHRTARADCQPERGAAGAPADGGGTGLD